MVHQDRVGALPIFTIEPLKENLEKYLTLLKEFKKLSLLKQESLIQNDLKQLDAITTQEERLLLQVGILDEERLAWSDKINVETGKKSEEITFAELCLRYPQLNSLHKELKENIAELQKIYKTNAELIDQALKIVNFSMNLLTPSEKSTYRRPAEKETTQPKLHLLDQKI